MTNSQNKTTNTMTELSPAAQALWRVFQRAVWDSDDSDPRQAGIAAALEVLADQVTPTDADEPRNYLPMALECQRIRSEILAIAAELRHG